MIFLPIHIPYVLENIKKNNINVLTLIGKISHDETKSYGEDMGTRYYSIWGKMVCYFTLSYRLEEMRFI